MKYDVQSRSIGQWSPAAIRRELNRKRKSLRQQAIGLDEEEALLLRQKANAAKRRPYVYKNNGKGRPRKKIKQFSKEKVQRRQLVGKAIVLIEELCSVAEDLKDVGTFQALLVGLAAEERSRTKFDQVRLRTLQGLCRQFCDRVPNKFPLPWQTSAVRAFLDIVGHKAARIASLSDPKGGGRITPGWGEARAEATIIDRLFRLADVQSDTGFVTALNTYRDAPPQQEVFAPQEWKQIWQEACDRLHQRTAKVFVIRAVGQVKRPKRKRPAANKGQDLALDNSTPGVIPLDL